MIEGQEDVAWDAWRGLGMAAGPPAPEAGQPARHPPAAMELRPFDHPLLTQRTVGGDAQDAAYEETFLSHFRATESWFLAEHRLGGSCQVLDRMREVEDAHRVRSQHVHEPLQPFGTVLDRTHHLGSSVPRW